MPYSRHHHSGSNGQLIGFLAGCFAGMVIGGVLGVLMAPHRGDITRRKVVRKAGEAKNDVVGKVEDLMVHRREDENGDDEEEDS